MEGRWTIHWTSGHDLLTGPIVKQGEEVPVVPCDDAAIERAARAIAGEAAVGMDLCRKLMVVAFRAAGETP